MLISLLAHWYLRFHFSRLKYKMKGIKAFTKYISVWLKPPFLAFTSSESYSTRFSFQEMKKVYFGASFLVYLKDDFVTENRMLKCCAIYGFSLKCWLNLNCGGLKCLTLNIEQIMDLWPPFQHGFQRLITLYMKITIKNWISAMIMSQPINLDNREKAMYAISVITWVMLPCGSDSAKMQISAVWILSPIISYLRIEEIVICEDMSSFFGVI